MPDAGRRRRDARNDHVLIGCSDEPHVYLVIVLDLKTLSVVGHHLLDLSLRYPME